MAIGTSLGAMFDDEFHFQQNQHDSANYPDNNTIDPETTLDLNSNDNNVKPVNAGPTGITIRPISDDKPDYDYDAWKANNPGVEMAPGQHYPDTYKLPNHMTFSDESIYHGINGASGGTWGKDGEVDTFTPGRTNLENHSMNDLKDYFARVEPNAKLLPPDINDVPHHDWVERAVIGMADAVRAPGDALAGKLPGWAMDPETGEFNTSQQVIEKANSLAGLMVGGPAPLAAKMVDGTLGSFAGVRSKTLDKGALEVAQTAKAAGHSADEIYSKTGFYQGPDQRWRYEINDSGATWNPPKPRDDLLPTTLGKTLDHPELYEAYPKLKDMKVVVDPYYRAHGALFNGEKIVMGTEAAKDKGILMHEVQHAIQDLEGFAKGGEPGKVGKDYKLRYEDDVDKLRIPFLNLQSKETKGAALSAEEQSKLDFLKHVFKKYSEYASAGDIRARENYLALAGETEARNVQTRVDLTPTERLRFPQRATEDTPPHHQIVSPFPIKTNPYLTSGSVRR